MDIDKLIVVPKESKLEWDMRALGLNHNELVERYQREEVDLNRILESHERQKHALQVVTASLNPNQIVSRAAFTAEVAKSASIVVALGGDNHFQFVSHRLLDTPIIGVNSDPMQSEGALTSVEASDFPRALQLLRDGRFDVEAWTRLEAFLDGVSVGYATSDIFLGEARRQEMSRHILHKDGLVEEQKCSGIIIATGAGSTGWYSSACRYYFPEGNVFSKSGDTARFIVAEPYRGKLSGFSLLEGELHVGQELVVKSLNDSHGVLLLDALSEHSFARGDTAKIVIGSHPLRVVRVQLL
jgi:hypothetical protein